MRSDRSYGYVPRDWWFILVLHLVIPATLLVSAWLALVVGRVREGDFTFFRAALACAAIGILLLFVAKWPLYQHDRYFSFGPKALPEKRRKLYWMAWALLGISLLTMLLLLAVLR